MLSRRQAIGLCGIGLLGAQPRSSMFADAQAYERFMGRWSRLLAPLLIDFARLPETGTVLDVGSGTGSLSIAITQQRPRVRVTGIDPSSEYVGYATSRNSAAQFQVGDAQKLEFAAGRFDAAVSLLVINFIPDRAAAVRELRRVVKPGGSVAAAVWDYSDGMKMLRVFWDAAVALDPGAQKRNEAGMPLCRSGELASFFESQGLHEVEQRPLEIRCQFASFSDYWEPFLLGQGPAGAYARGLDEARRNALREEIKRKLNVADEAREMVLSARAWAARGVV
jgi:SAM-dependent methyltransferase